MKISLIGLDWWGGITRYTEEALTRLGHDVEPFYYWPAIQYAAPWKRGLNRLANMRYIHGALRRLIGSNQGTALQDLRSGFEASLLKRMNQALIKAVLRQSPDLIFVIKGETILPETLAGLKKDLKVPVVSWLMDKPFPEGAPNFISQSLRLMDHVFIFDSYYVDELQRAGVKNVHHLPFACNPEIYRTIKLSNDEADIYRSQVSFMGVSQPRREKMIMELSQFDLRVWGPGWTFAEYNNARVVNRVVPLEEAVKIYNASEIVLNQNHPQSVYGTNMRTFEVAACGAFQLTDHKKEMDAFFEPGAEMVYYNDIDDLKEKIQYYLSHPKERMAIAARAQLRVQLDHTYERRMTDVLRIINGG